MIFSVRILQNIFSLFFCYLILLIYKQYSLSSGNLLIGILVQTHKMHSTSLPVVTVKSDALVIYYVVLLEVQIHSNYNSNWCRNKISIEFKRKWKYIFIARLYVNVAPKRNNVTGTAVNGLCYLQSQLGPMHIERHSPDPTFLICFKKERFPENYVCGNEVER